MTTYTNKQGVTIKHGDRVRYVSALERRGGTIPAGTIATAEYHEVLNREPFWVLNVGAEWNPMESHSEHVTLFENVVLADSPAPLSSAKNDDTKEEAVTTIPTTTNASPFAKILAWRDEQLAKERAERLALHQKNRETIAQGKLDLCNILEQLGIEKDLFDIEDGDLQITDDDNDGYIIHYHEVFCNVEGYEFSLRSPYHPDHKDELTPFVAEASHLYRPERITLYITQELAEYAKTFEVHTDKKRAFTAFQSLDSVFKFVGEVITGNYIPF